MLKLTAHVHAWVLEAADALRRREEGQTMAEYGVILAVITAAIITALVFLSGNIASVLNRVASAVK
jgi:Flp pilus assembly pilin Flp